MISSEEGMLSWLQMITVYRAVIVAEGPEMAQGHGATWRKACDKGTPEVQPQLSMMCTLLSAVFLAALCT